MKGERLEQELMLTEPMVKLACPLSKEKEY